MLNFKQGKLFLYNNTSKLADRLDTFAIIWIILTSGTMVFNILNMFFSMMVLLAIALVYLFKLGRIKSTNIYTFLALLLFTIISTLINGVANVVTNDAVILLIRIFSLAVIMGCISDNKFKKVYINTIYIIALISLPCFFITYFNPSFKLPFTFINYKNNFYGTFYYTLGTPSEGIFYRNSGIFWEAGLFQIYLNYALVLLVTDKNNLFKNRIRKFIVMSIAVVTTLSTMGFLCYGLVVITAIFNRKGKGNKMILMASFLAIIILMVVESSTHIIEGKLIDKSMSYGSRHDDTIISMLVIKDNPILGVGPINNHGTIFNSYLTSSYRLTQGNLSKSNGIGTFCMKFGIPITLIYLLLLYQRTKRLAQVRFLENLLICAILVGGFSNEPIMFTTLWLSFFFKWGDGFKNNSRINEFKVKILKNKTLKASLN